DGTGQTIAIVDAYADPNIATDLTNFDQQFNLPAPPSFTVRNLNAGGTPPNWAAEEAADVEWAHAMAPGANILLLEGDNTGDLGSAAAYAAGLPGVSVMSMSWANTNGEYQGENDADHYFTTPEGHQGVTFVAAAGDNGSVNYPAASPDVVGVGG